MSVSYRISTPARREIQESPSPASTLGIISVVLMILLLLRRHSQAPRGWRTALASAGNRLPGTVPATGFVDLLDLNEATAVFLVGTRNDPGPRMIDAFAPAHGSQYRQILFLAVGAVEAEEASLREGSFPGRAEPAEQARRITRRAVTPYLEAARNRGFKADCRISVAADPGKEIGRLADGVLQSYSRIMVFLGDPVAEQSPSQHRGIPSATVHSILQYLSRRGIPVTVIPVVERSLTQD